MTAFAWIDIMGIPPVNIEATVIYGEWPGDGHVLVDAATRDRMAEAVIASGILTPEDDAAWAAHVRAMPAAPEDWPGLFDATDVGGGWDSWAEMQLDVAP